MTYLDEAVKAAAEWLGGYQGWARKLLADAEPFIRADERAKAVKLVDDIEAAATDSYHGGEDERAEHIADAIADARSYLASHPTPADGYACVRCADTGLVERDGDNENVPCPDCTPDGPASPVLPEDDHPILLALREALGEELEQSEDWRNDEGEEFIPNDPSVEALGVTIADKVKPLLGASPVLGDEERERLKEKLTAEAEQAENTRSGHEVHGEGVAAEYAAGRAAGLRRAYSLAQGEERDA